MIKWLLSKWYKDNPDCMCGYKMKPTKDRGIIENSWKCVWKKCGWETYESLNGKLHWWRSIR